MKNKYSNDSNKIEESNDDYVIKQIKKLKKEFKGFREDLSEIKNELKELKELLKSNKNISINSEDINQIVPTKEKLNLGIVTVLNDKYLLKCNNVEELDDFHYEKIVFDINKTKKYQSLNNEKKLYLSNSRIVFGHPKSGFQNKTLFLSTKNNTFIVDGMNYLLIQLMEECFNE